jgi:hypothetical protein
LKAASETIVQTKREHHHHQEAYQTSACLDPETSVETTTR